MMPEKVDVQMLDPAREEPGTSPDAFNARPHCLQCKVIYEQRSGGSDQGLRAIERIEPPPVIDPAAGGTQ
jgi:hypothetical protein